MFLSSLASATSFKIASKAFAAITSESYSVGHICWDGEYEWYQQGGNVLRAHKSDVIDCRTGNRQGRFQTTVTNVPAYPSVYAHLGQFVGLCQQGMGEFVGV
jgi:hypothetical protein